MLGKHYLKCDNYVFDKIKKYNDDEKSTKSTSVYLKFYAGNVNLKFGDKAILSFCL